MMDELCSGLVMYYIVKIAVKGCLAFTRSQHDDARVLARLVRLSAPKNQLRVLPENLLLY